MRVLCLVFHSMNRSCLFHSMNRSCLFYGMNRSCPFHSMNRSCLFHSMNQSCLFLQHESQLPFLQHESELPFLQHESELRNVVRHVKERRETRVMRLETDVSSELPLTSLEPATLAWQMSKLKCSNNRLCTQSSERLSENSALCHWGLNLFSLE